MASAASKVIGKVGTPISKGAGKAISEASNNPNRNQVLQKEARRNPELYVCRVYSMLSLIMFIKGSDSSRRHEHSFRLGWLALWYVVQS